VINHPIRSSIAVKVKTGSAKKTVKYKKDVSVKRLLGINIPRKSGGFLNGLNI